jgi:hypothetical protein
MLFFVDHTGCLKIREFRIQSVVGTRPITVFFVLYGRKEKFSPLEKEKSDQISKPTKDEKTFFLCVSTTADNIKLEFLLYSFPIKRKKYYTGCLKIREYRIQSVVGNDFSSPNMEIKKNRDSLHKDTLV